jgi:IclR family acetate operon transcriptional repressor
VQSVERAFALLEAKSRRDRGSGVTELAEDSGLSPSTIPRLLQTLVARSYVRQEPGRASALGSGLIRLGEQAASGVATWSLPLLTELVAQLGESVNLAGLSGEEVVYMAHVPSAQSMRMVTEVGSRVAAHSTGVGKAMLVQHHVRALRAPGCPRHPVHPNRAGGA